MSPPSMRPSSLFTLSTLAALIAACGGGSRETKNDAGVNADVAVVDTAASDGRDVDGGVAVGDSANDSARRQVVGWSPCGSLPVAMPTGRRPWAFAVSGDGRTLALLDSLALGAQERQQVAWVWNLDTGALVRRIGPPFLAWGSWATDIDLSPKGDVLAATGDACQIIRVADATLLWEEAPPAGVTAEPFARTFAMSPDGRLLADGSPLGARIVDAATGQPLRQLARVRASQGFAFSPDGQLLASSLPSVVRVSDGTTLWAAGSDAAAAGPDVAMTDNWSTFSPSGREVLFQHADMRVTGMAWSFSTATTIVDAASGRIIRNLPLNSGRRAT
ncbi:MAG TPA: WD40 repeat domain-containing protein, partial [Polyangia bacterium]